LLLGVTVILTEAVQAEEPGEEQTTAQTIYQETGVKGGLVLHLGCGDGKLTAALCASDAYLIQALDRDPEDVERARETIRSAGLYGRVSVEHVDGGGSLPYVDNLVNLVVAEDPGDVAMSEVMRVLAPNGVAYTRTGDTWTKTVKPWPAAIDDWTHYLYDASNNAVSDDRVVGPPKQLQWISGPLWTRSHDHLASVSAAVSSGGRLFYIVDEAPIALTVLQPNWTLVARDAFSGVVLWKRPIDSWQWHLRGFRSGPTELSRRLVAIDDRVYATLGVDAPIVALHAATGETVATYEATKQALEFVCSDEVLYAVVGDRAIQEAVERSARRGERPGYEEVRPQRPGYAEIPPVKHVVAIDIASGRTLWTKADADTSELMPSTLAVCEGQVFLQNPDEILCLAAGSGDLIWRTSRPISKSRPTWSTPTLVIYDDVVLSAERAVVEKNAQEDGDDRKVAWTVASTGGQAPVGELIAFSAEDGRRLWSCPSKECYNSPIDVLVADGLVWTGQLVRAAEPGITEGRDPKTGEVKRTRPNDQEFFACGMGHGRCYRNKATNRYLVLGRSGTEFVDVRTGEAFPHHWTRGTCQYGVIPCNGLLYVPPHSCACFIRSKLIGFHALAGRETRDQGPESRVKRQEDNTGTRLERGPAYDGSGLEPDAGPALDSGRSTLDSASAWPTYRGDAARSGRAAVAVPAELLASWQTDLGGRLTSVVIAEAKVFVAQVDQHTVHALNEEGGQLAWSFTAGGRVDSPPTICKGRVLFGSADGSVYCLRSTDGALIWQFRAAPSDRRIVAFDQVESAWPVHGSVLVKDGVAYCAAGRSSYLDGSLRLCRLDVATGKLLSETAIDHRDPDTGYQVKGSVRGTNMPGALPDVLSSDGQSVFMRHTRFDLSGQPQPPEIPHLYSAAGFLDDSWWHRTYWQVSSAMSTNYGGWPQTGSRVPAGRLLVLDESNVYGFGRSQYIHHGAHVGIDGATVFHFRSPRDDPKRFTHYRAFAISTEPTVGPKQTPGGAAKKAPRPAAKQYLWTSELPVLARAMVLAGDNLFFAGPPEVGTTDDPAGALQGRGGGALVALSATDGSLLATRELDSPPVFDGIAAAGGRLYMATMDGKVLCLAGK
jgi:outer membrane protein assembly factor BamB